MRGRVKVSGRKDHRIFSKTAARKNKKNLPGHNLMRGGTCL